VPDPSITIDSHVTRNSVIGAGTAPIRHRVGTHRPLRRRRHPADVQNRAAFPKLLHKAKPIAPAISHVCVDKGYTGHTVAGAAARAGVTATVVSGPKPDRRFIAQPAPMGG
jgi:hypothetical protein